MGIGSISRYPPNDEGIFAIETGIIMLFSGYLPKLRVVLICKVLYSKFLQGHLNVTCICDSELATTLPAWDFHL